MNSRNILAGAVFCAIFGLSPSLEASAVTDDSRQARKEAISLYERGYYERAEEILTSIGRDGDPVAEGYRVLCMIRQQDAGYLNSMEEYIAEYPYSSLIPQMRFHHAANLFAAGDYAEAIVQYEILSRRQIYKSQLNEFLFNRAYCDFENGIHERALKRFVDLAGREESDYTAPAQYFAAYLLYGKENFKEAERRFSIAAKDSRFTEISNYYILECRFMQKDYRYIVDRGPAMLSQVPDDRKPRLSRLISESWLVLGDAGAAREYFSPDSVADSLKTDSDYFYAGTVLYEVGDWQGAAENLSRISDRTDSLGQVASYQLAFSQIQLKNKVAAMEAFRDAARTDYDPVIREDAFFNYAKLAYDLNGDGTGFEDYMSVYSDKKRGEEIYSYIALGCLQKRDYAAAVDAYDRIDILDSDMKSNYMKANYLRARQLIEGSSWRAAVPYLKTAAWYADRREALNQLCRFWLAEAYYRDGKYDDALSILTDLYNTSALDGRTESSLIPYSIAFCHFQKGDYGTASTWFGEFISTGTETCRKEALTRLGDCNFYQRNYAGGIRAYDQAYDEFPDVNDIYPYYMSAVASGLAGNTSDKIRTLSRVTGADPSSAYYPEAVYELGKAYALSGDAANADATFDRLIASSRDSSYIAMALIEKGTLARNKSDNQTALACYKKVIESMPGSEYSENAMAAVESVYKAMNDPEGYLAYIESIGKSSIKTEAEKEDMIFSSAEQVFLSGNLQKSITSLQSYLEKYPDGARVAQAEFYLGEAFRMSGQSETARDHYAIAMEKSGDSFKELSTLRYSELSYSLQLYEDAFAGYTSLGEIAFMKENVQAAKVGMMRSAFAGKMWQKAVDAASLVRTSDASSDQDRREADYVKAKSLLSVSLRDEALGIFSDLAANPSDNYGAEAAYILISDCYDRGDFKAVEERTFAFAESGNPVQYWLAKSFVVLGDAYAEQGDFAQAKATFESVRDGYNPAEPDDVKDNLDIRIQKAAEALGAN